MAVVKYLARHHHLQVSTDSGATYTTVSGLNTLTLKQDKKSVDVTDFDSNGRITTLPVSIEETLTAEGFRVLDETAGTQDAGQQAVENSFNDFGYDALLYYKVRHVNEAGTQVGHVVFQAWANPSDLGGGNDDAMPFGVELMIYGTPTASGTLAARF